MRVDIEVAIYIESDCSRVNCSLYYVKIFDIMSALNSLPLFVFISTQTFGPLSQYIYISSGGMYKGDMPAGGYMEACCQVRYSVVGYLRIAL